MSKRDLARCARVCKTWFDPVTDELWGSWATFTDDVSYIFYLLGDLDLDDG